MDFGAARTREIDRMQMLIIGRFLKVLLPQFELAMQEMCSIQGRRGVIS
jgi:hypothetical protein